jgi:hypothetical protein
MRPVEIALVDHTDKNKRFVESQMKGALVALNIQAAQLRRHWTSAPAAVVFELKDLKDIEDGPPGVWPIVLTDHLSGPGNGFHATAHHRPYAEVAVDDAHWTIAASHEMLEMLIDPSGNRLQVGRAVELDDAKKIADGTTNVEYLLEICDPCAAHECAYRVNDTTWVSDFVTPDFYAPRGIPDTLYTFRHNIKSPRHILPGGYITWVHAKNKQAFMHQMLWLGTKTPTMPKDPVVVGLSTAAPNLRAFSDATMGASMHQNAGNVRKNMTPRYQLEPGRHTKEVEHKEDHWVTFHCDGTIERTVWETGKKDQPFTYIEQVKAHEPVMRRAGTNQIVRNCGCGPIAFDKDPISPR